MPDHVVLPLVNSKRVAIADPEFAHFQRYRWRLDHKGYAYRNSSYVPPGKTWREKRSTHLLLHREVLSLTAGDGLQADHINADRLDNRTTNLRIVTNAQNWQNLRARTGTFRGTSPGYGGRWIACVKLNYKTTHLGTFDTEVDAARAAEAFRRQHMPFHVPDERLTDLPVCPCRACSNTLRPYRGVAA